MKIAMMTNSYKPFVAGVPISIERLSDSLMELGHDVTIFAPTYAEQQDEENIVRYQSMLQGIYYGFSVPNSMDRRIEKMFVPGDYDIIHVHHPMLIGWTALYLSRKYHVPLAFTYHTRYEQYLHYVKASMFKNIVPEYVRLFIRQCDLVFAPTAQMKDYLEKIDSRTDIAILPTGLPEEHFRVNREKSASLRSSLKGGKKYLFCTAARLAKEKNIGFLLESLAIRKNTTGSDFIFALIGEGPEKENLAGQAEALGLSDEVRFLGKVPNHKIKDYFNAADLFLFSSVSETQGIVILESMAAGTPVLAVRATGVEDIVVNGRNGYMTELSQTEYARKLADILDRDEISLLTPGAQDTARSYHTAIIAERALIGYESILRGKEERSYHRYHPMEKLRMLMS